MKKVFDLLRRKGLTNHEKIEDAIMYKWSLKDILDLNESLLDVIEIQPEGNNDITNFNFVANSSLSAQISGPCVELNCRLRRADRLARFAALYSDRIYVQNYFDQYPQKIPHMPTEWLDETLRTQFAGDLEVLLALKPLLESGIVCLVKHPAFHICPSCLEKSLPALAETRKTLEKQIQVISDNYLEHTSAVLNLDYPFPYECCIDLKGPDDLFENGESSEVRADPWLLKKVNSARRRTKAQEIRLSKKELKRAGIIEDELRKVTMDILLQHFCSRFLNAKYLTDRDIDVQLLDSLTYDDDFKAYNEVARSRLLYELPVLDDVPLDFLLAVRKNEHEAFLVYRNTISQVIREYLSQRRHISDQDAQQIYEDIIYPRLCELNAKVTSIKSSAWNAFKRDIAITSTVAVLGMYSGILPLEMKAIVAGLGGLNAAKDTLKLLGRSITTPDEIRSDNFYYLWKVSKGNVKPS